jgi:hypothetical protein
MNVLNHQEYWYLLWLVDLEKNDVKISVMISWFGKRIMFRLRLIFLYGMNVRPGIIQITLLSILEGNNWPKVSMWLAAVQNYDVFFSLKQYFQSSLEGNQDIIYINGTGFLLWHLLIKSAKHQAWTAATCSPLSQVLYVLTICKSALAFK